jgi:hypothetical protein
VVQQCLVAAAAAAAALQLSTQSIKPEAGRHKGCATHKNTRAEQQLPSEHPDLPAASRHCNLYSATQRSVSSPYAAGMQTRLAH